MSNGKYARQPQRRRRTHKKKASFLLTSMILLLTLIVGGTVSFLVASSSQVENTFTPSHVTCRVDETFANNTKSNVTIANTGDTTAYIRAAIVVTWKDSNGNVYPQTPDLGMDYTMTLLDNTSWTKIGNYYYYKYPVAKNSSTGVLITSCSPIAGQTPEGYGLNVEILGSAIQSVPARVVTESWGVTPDSNGNIG